MINPSFSSPSSSKKMLAFDYQATTPGEQEVLEAMAPYWTEAWGNASSRQNRFGLHASAAVNLAREQIAACLQVRPEDIQL